MYPKEVPQDENDKEEVKHVNWLNCVLEEDYKRRVRTNSLCERYIHIDEEDARRALDNYRRERDAKKTATTAAPTLFDLIKSLFNN